MDRAAFSPSLDKTKSQQQAWQPYGALGAAVNLGSSALTPPPGSLATSINLFNPRLSAAPGTDRAFPGGAGARNGTINLFGSSNSIFAAGGKHRHNSIDNKQVNRSKLLEDFR